MHHPPEAIVGVGGFHTTCAISGLFPDDNLHTLRVDKTAVPDDSS